MGKSPDDGSLPGLAGKLDAALKKAADAGKGFKSAVATFFNQIVVPSMISALEVFHILFKLPMHFESRTHVSINVAGTCKKIKQKDESKDD